MILPFSTQLNGKPTFFIQKIWASLLKIDFDLYDDYLHLDGLPPQMPLPPSSYKSFTPKIHTIREDKNNRWKAGVMIDFFINCRTKSMFRFAPSIPVVSTQEVKIKYYNFYDDYNKKVDVYVDDCFLGQYYFSSINPNKESELIELAQNDGFDTVEDFFVYFNKDFKGKLIHWTDKRY